jgi:hypothetical protein
MKRTGVLLLVSVVLGCPRVDASEVNWPRFLKVNPWTYEIDEVRYPNHSNVDPGLILSLVEASEASLSAPARMLGAARKIGAMPGLHAEQRAGLMRDALDAIHEIHPTWRAYDQAAGNHAVLFFGGYSTGDSRFALALSLGNGKFYKGSVNCALLFSASWNPEFGTNPIWQSVEKSGAF